MAAGSMLVVPADVVEAAQDEQLPVLMLEQLARPPEALDTPDRLLAARQCNGLRCNRIVPLIAFCREHTIPGHERFA